MFGARFSSKLTPQEKATAVPGSRMLMAPEEIIDVAFESFKDEPLGELFWACEV